VTTTAPDRVAGPVAPPAPPAQPRVVLAGLAAALVLGAVIATTADAATAVLFGVGVALGLVLFHSRFGFTSAWRQLVAVRQGRGLRAHLLMLGVACTLFAPVLASGASLTGTTPTPSLTPLGVPLVVGALLFGAGMQIGGSCASGTLFAVGSGQTAIVLTLAGFVGGSTLGALNLPWWQGLPAHEAVSLTRWGGYAGAWALSLVALALVALASVAWTRRGPTPPPLDPPPTARGWARVVRGSWPLWVGALLLAGLNALTLLLSGRAWGITFAFALWGSKLLDAVGVDVGSWGFWQDPANAAKYDAGVLAETTSVMDLGIILGALVAAALAGTWVLHRRVPPRLALGAVVGGLMMGYGARLASGCNIGAYFGGIASFSLHGWVWGLLALVGTWVGLRLRPLFGLGNPRPTDSVC